MTAPALRDSQLMGRAAVVVLCGISGLVGIARLLGVNVSGLVADFGGGAVDLTWAVTLIAAAALVTWSWLDPDEDRAALCEVVGLAFHAAAAAFYLLAIFNVVGVLTEALFVLGYVVAAVINCSARAILLVRRMRWVRKAEQ